MAVDPIIFTCFSNTIYNVSSNDGDYTEAEKLIRRVLAIHKKVLGNKNAEIAKDCNYLGVVLQAQGKGKEAEHFYREALEISRNLPKSDRDDMSSLNNLGQLLMERGELTEAEKLMREAISLDSKQLGENHPYVASDLDRLGRLLTSKGELMEAEKIQLQALAIRRKILGNDHPDIALSLEALARIHYYKGEMREAENQLQQVLEITRKTYGNEHPEVARNLGKLALILTEEDKLEEAKKLFEEALIMNRKLLGENNPDVATNLVGLAEVALAQGETKKAFPLLKEALNIPTENVPELRLIRIRAKSAFGACLLAQKDYQQAEAFLLKAFKEFSDRGLSRDLEKARQRIINLYKAWDKTHELEKFQEEFPQTGTT